MGRTMYVKCDIKLTINIQYDYYFLHSSPTSTASWNLFASVSIDLPAF